MAAGASVSENGSTGSGIYSGQYGALKSFTANPPTTKVIISAVPKIPGNSTLIGPPIFAEVFDPTETIEVGRGDLNEHKVKWLNFDENSTQIGTVCHGIICCNYNISVRINVLPENTSQTV